MSTQPATSFWRDFGLSFAFIFEAENLIAVSILIACVIAVSTFAGFVPLVGIVVWLGLQGYLASFYFGTVLETASGEDGLPNVWIDNVWDDLFRPALLFIGTVLYISIPSLVALALQWITGRDIPQSSLQVLFLAGAMFWPMVVLMVAVFDGFGEAWPNRVVTGILAAPLGYLGLILVMLAALGMQFIGDADWYASLRVNSSLGQRMALRVVETALEIYLMIVTMRVIGLYYRHFKHRLPWAPE